MDASVGVGTSTDRRRGPSEGSAWNSRDTSCEVQHRRAVEHLRIVEADSARHAVAELRGVLDVIDAGDVVGTAHQERVVVARIAVPGRRVGRSRLTEGETSELDEHHFNW